MIGNMASEEEDEREIELSSISAIFPELILDANDPFSASIDIPVTPSVPLPVVFPELSDNSSVATTSTVRPQPGLESHLLSHLPSLNLQITLPDGYPALNPPIFQLSTSPQWLSSAVLERFLSDGQRLWEEFGHCQVVYAYIDHLQQAATEAFGVLGESENFRIPQDLQIPLLGFDIKAKRAAFENETFDCGVCLDPKKGSACHRMLGCGHVFCRQCLQDFYSNAIKEGDLASVKCLAPDCAKKRTAVGESPAGKRRKPKTQISPSELLLLPLEHEMVKRYVTLKHKAELESDKTTIYCPRKWCQGAARSRKHRKPSQLIDGVVSSDEESEDENEATSKTGLTNWGDLLAVCEDCSFAFCSRCFHSWHGEFTICATRTKRGELTEEDKASMEYLKLHTTPCPTCAAPAQKTHGCNHMICFKCNTHFCYLCSTWLEPGNPYQHYNTQTTACFMRLWELEGGDGDDVGIGFAGGVQHREQVAHAEEHPPPVAEPIAAAEVVNEDPQQQVPDAAPPLVEPVAREGPLVLRIGQLPPRPAVPPAQAAPAVLGRRPPRRPGAAAAAPALRRRGNQPAPRAAGRGRGRGDAAAAIVDHAGFQGIAEGMAEMMLRHLERGEHRAPAANANADPDPGLGPEGIEWVQNLVQVALLMRRMV